MKILVVICFLAIACSEGYRRREEPCWRLGGNCLPTSSCPSRYRLNGKCPSQPNNIKCCIPHQESSCPGKCQRTDKECSGTYRSNLCRTQPSNVKCCVARSGQASNQCGETVKNLACQLKNHRNLRLLTVQVSGVNDGADVKSNILDSCNGKKAKRSNYGNAPGGYVCLKASMLKTLKQIADSINYTLQVNCLAGGSHSRDSKHYQGGAFDLQIQRGDNTHWRQWVKICKKNHSTWTGYPGISGHSTHVHCQFR